MFQTFARRRRNEEAVALRRDRLALMEDESTESHMRADYESTPLARSEYIAAVVHLYRGELSRSISWRMRLDNTTNWAVITTAGLLTFAFGTVDHSHWVILIGMALIAVFLTFEARRYRYEDVWRHRVRKIEENFYGPILRRDPISPEKSWGSLVARELFEPSFQIGRLEAIRARLVGNYWAIFGVLGFAWCVKLFIHPTPAHGWGELRDRLSMGFLPWWLPLAYLGTFLAVCLAIVLNPQVRRHNDLTHGHDHRP